MIITAVIIIMSLAIMTAIMIIIQIIIHRKVYLSLKQRRGLLVLTHLLDGLPSGGPIPLILKVFSALGNKSSSSRSHRPPLRIFLLAFIMAALKRVPSVLVGDMRVFLPLSSDYSKNDNNRNNNSKNNNNSTMGTNTVFCNILCCSAKSY